MKILPVSPAWMAPVLAVALFQPAGAAETWPQFRGRDGQGHASADAVPPTHWSETQNIRWKAAIHGRGWSSPVIWDNRIWLTTATEDGREMFVVCLDRETGEILHDRRLFHNDKPDEIHATNSYA